MSALLGSIATFGAGVVENRAGARAFEKTSPAETNRVIESPTDEQQLMAGVGRGDRKAYRELVDQYLLPITRFAERMLGNRSEAEDVVQETFLRLWTRAAGFTPRAQPKTWLYRVARNLCIDRLRQRRDVSDGVEQQSGGDRPSSLLLRKQTALQVERALLALPERQRAAITLVHYEGLDTTQACAVLEVSVDALESLLARARRSLRELLRENADTEGERP